MSEETQDKWAKWVLERQFGGDSEKQKAGLAAVDGMRAIRDRVLRDAAIKEGDIVLDVGCGSGLIGFGALPLVGESGKVIFSDISQDLLDHCRPLALEMGVLEQCVFLRASADDLSVLADASVDVVTTRSVLIYVKNKEQAFREFWRVLRPSGRLAIFEPINRFSETKSENTFLGCDITPVVDVARKLRDLYDGFQPPETDPMLDFDERDLIALAEKAGFCEVHLELRADVTPFAARRWEDYVRVAFNPKVPSLEEAMNQVLTPEEKERYVAYVRPIVELGKGTVRMAVANLRAIK